MYVREAAAHCGCRSRRCGRVCADATGGTHASINKLARLVAHITDFFRHAFPCTKGRTGTPLAYDSHAGTRPRGVGPAAWCCRRRKPTNSYAADCGRESITVRPTHTLRCRNAVCGACQFLALCCRAASAHAHRVHRAHRARHAPDAHRDRARFHLMCLHQSCWRDTPEWGQLERWAQAARALRGENAARRARGGGLRCYALMQRAPRP